jgi:hypothetical protein
MKWYKVQERLPNECTKVLAIFLSEKDAIYN